MSKGPRKTFDLDKLAAEVERIKAERETQRQAELLRNTQFEARLLAAMIADVNCLDHCEDVELDDFTDFRYRAAFKSLRNLQAAGSPCGLLDIVDDIAMEDIEMGKNVADTVNAYFLGLLILDEPPFYANLDELNVCKRYLRTLADRRRAL